MTLQWLPYGTARQPFSTAACARPEPLARFLPLPARPPAVWYRSAAAIPSILIVLLVCSIGWALYMPPSSFAPPEPRLGIVSEAPSLLISPAFPAPVLHWASQIARWADESGLPPDLVAVVMTLESCGDPTATSAAGARGLFQVMPFHFSPDEDSYDPEVNARRGLAYMSRGLDLAAGEPSLALAGYNGGHGLIARPPDTWPAETARYVRWGSGILNELRAGQPSSTTLQAWLDAGGASLCAAAERKLP